MHVDRALGFELKQVGLVATGLRVRDVRAPRAVEELERIFGRGLGRLDVDGQAGEAVLGLKARDELDLARRRPEAGLAVEAQKRLLVLAGRLRREELHGLQVRKHALLLFIRDAPVLEDRVAGLDGIAVEEGLGVADGGADRAGDLPVLPGFALRLHGTAHAHLAAVHAEGRVALEVEGGGQHDVHVVMRFVTVEVVGGKREVDLPDGLLILFGRGPDEGVHAEARDGADAAVPDHFGEHVRAAEHLHFVPDGHELAVDALCLLLGLVEPLLVNEGSRVTFVPANNLRASWAACRRPHSRRCP